ncbi:hypothetical protein CMI37_00580 [Candidatus Pacearchaeota archaeon]|nr:hypothetical protein [Candidatus Pacearchaeota archaeon]
MSWVEKVKYFSPEGDLNLNDPYGDIMSHILMLTMDTARKEMNVPFNVTSGYRTWGTPNSAHPDGMAIDGYFKGIPILHTFLHLVRFKQFHGIGLYPYTTPPVIHVDVKDRDAGRQAMWIWNKGGRYVYSPGGDFRRELIAAVKVLTEET